MSQNSIIAGIDVGNARVKTVIADIDRDSGHPHIIGVGISESSGLRKGMVIDMTETIRSINESIKLAESMSGVKIKEAYVSISGLHVRSQISRGVIAVSRADNEISQNDIGRVIDAASTVSLPPNREKLHVIAKQFIIDGQEYVKNPLGMKGVRIEADVLIIDGLSPYIHNIAKAINENNVEVVEFVFSPLASALAILDRNQKEHGVLNLDIGGGVSTLSFFREGDLVHTAILPVGSRHITNDLAIALRTSMPVAEKIKLKYGHVTKEKISKKEEIDLSEALGDTEAVFSREELNQVIKARVDEINEMVSKEIKKLGPISIIPAGVVLSGGGANLAGLVNFSKEALGLPIRLGSYQSFEGMVDQIKNPAFAVAAGLILWGLENNYTGSSGGSFGGGVKLFKGITNWAKNFLP
ncbi:MAG: cell division protein FtsA [Candidatus Yanofskybacteria bacterium CG10_big_fil_rev_8_21_14_0_10_46_23]|uniref:Cell division protein FtsA n=1 Tax=Candidatus Yanofskybacteria bacterium CG10_big_fil_rev_8_21_14_0_10_46_23 TaxID=1975098 RepID=A0A2H0R4I7_9BACT|nr:MAG: cell division protein FtsA [Candidatus Yanofskybacteria bacterium CG10_big_fil_rev_8_21_14_0_10_46_23]